MLFTLLLSGLLASPVVAGNSIPVDSVLVQDQVNLDKNLVRWGNPANFDPAKKALVGTVRTKEVYRMIPAWQLIQKEKVKKGTARHEVLMREATAVYERALGRAAKARNTVLIVEQGGISGYASVADLTGAIIAAI